MLELHGPGKVCRSALSEPTSKLLLDSYVPVPLPNPDRVPFRKVYDDVAAESPQPFRERCLFLPFHKAPTRLSLSRRFPQSELLRCRFSKRARAPFNPLRSEHRLPSDQPRTIVVVGHFKLTVETTSLGSVASGSAIFVRKSPSIMPL